MSTNVHVNGNVQFTFFLVMKLNTTIVMSCDLLVLIFSSLKLENGMKKQVWNVARIKYQLVKLAVILFTFNIRYDYVIPSIKNKIFLTALKSRIAEKLLSERLSGILSQQTSKDK